MVDWEPPEIALRVTNAAGSMMTAGGEDSATTMQNLLGGYGPGYAGKAVTATTSREVAAVYACCQVISRAVASMPVNVYRRKADGSRDADEANPMYWLLNEQPHETMTASVFWDCMLTDRNLRGDGIAEIIRNASGQTDGFLWIPRDRVIIYRNKKTRSLEYYINYDDRTYALPSQDVIHLPGPGFDGVRGESVIKFAARNAISTAIATEQYSGSFFAKGANPSIVITYPSGVTMTPEQVQTLRMQVEEKMSGNGNHHRPFIATGGAAIDTLSISAHDAQLIETKKFSVIEIARAFGVPPHMIGETTASSSWGAGVEQMSLGFVRYTLGGLITQIQQELNRKILPRSTRFYVKFDTESLTSGDSRTDAEVTARKLGGNGSQGYVTVNEIRKKNGLKPMPGCDIIPFTLGNQDDTSARAATKDPEGAGDTGPSQDTGTDPAS